MWDAVSAMADNRPKCANLIEAGRIGRQQATERDGHDDTRNLRGIS